MRKIPVRSWQVVSVVALGIFVASYWFINGFITLLNESQLSIQVIIQHLLPGMGLLFIVLMAKRTPLPYGASLILLSIFIFISKIIKSLSWIEYLSLAGPLMLLGALFIGIKPIIERDNQKNS